MASYYTKTMTNTLAYLNIYLKYRKPLYQICQWNLPVINGSVYRSTSFYNTRYYSKNNTYVADSNDDNDNSKPVKFSTSEAAKWKAEYSRRGVKDDDTPSFQPYVVSLSLAVFLIYFLVLRESNDIDIKLGGGNLSATLANVERVQLELMIEEDESYNRQTDPKVLNRLKELKDLIAAEMID